MAPFFCDSTIKKVLLKHFVLFACASKNNNNNNNNSQKQKQ